MITSTLPTAERSRPRQDPIHNVPGAAPNRWDAFSRIADLSLRQAREIDRLNAEIARMKAAQRHPSKAIEWMAALLGVIGALLLATNFHPAFGFAWFLASNAGWIVYAVQGRCFGMLAQQVLFTGTSLVGLWNWWLGPIVLKSGLWAGVLSRPWFWLAAVTYLVLGFVFWRIVRVNHVEADLFDWAQK